MDDEKQNQPQIDADGRRYKHKELTERIIGIFYEVYNELGSGFLEKIYEEALAIVLRSRGLHVVQQGEVPVWFRGEKVGTYQADLIVESLVVIELKACRGLDSTHEAQLLHYLRATEIEVGLLFNFGPRPQVRRFAFDNERKMIGGHLAKPAGTTE